MARHIVARTSEIPPGGNKVVGVDGRDIVVFHVNGEFFALLNRCPHAGAPLEKAACVARLTSPEPGVYQRSRVGELLRCAWHGWEFDMRNGQSWFDPKRVKIRSYPVAIESGEELRRGLMSPRHFRCTSRTATSSSRCEGAEGWAELKRARHREHGAEWRARRKPPLPTLQYLSSRLRPPSPSAHRPSRRTMAAISLRNASTGTAISFCSRPSSTMPCTAENRLRAVTPSSAGVRFGNSAASGR